MDMVKKPMAFLANLLVGTSSWSSSDWLGSFYPANLKPGQFIEAYSRKFSAVEIDSTYYAILYAYRGFGLARKNFARFYLCGENSRRHHA
jgi:uncharacterized protein YecE (DUF72 family)